MQCCKNSCTGCFPKLCVSCYLILYIYLIDRVRGPYWENIGPRSWQYGPSRFGEVRTRKTEGRYSPSTARANSVNKRFITRLLVSEKTRTANATSMAAREDCQNQTDCIRRISCTTIIDTVVSILLSNASLYQSASCQIEIVFLTVLNWI